jgi:NAD(P)-dependent dehydrogenase (short-subunit alcohol dehydrogenase family)
MILHMKRIVITGSSRGIGRGLAENFLRHGCAVALNGRNPDTLAQTERELTAEFPEARITACPGDTTRTADLEQLWQTTTDAFGGVDVWIHNAGVGHPMQPVWELPETVVNRVVDVDYRGTLLAVRVAITGMLEQGHGHVYLMEGFGSNGRIRAGLAVYGSAKYAVRYLTRSLAAELKGRPVKVSALSPGMVITDFITEQYEGREEELERVKPIFNTIADRVETVTPWLVDRVLANTRSGNTINWLTGPKLFARFAFGWMRKRDLFDDAKSQHRGLSSAEARNPPD